MEPRLITPIPNTRMSTQAAENTNFLLYIENVLFYFALNLENHFKKLFFKLVFLKSEWEFLKKYLY